MERIRASFVTNQQFRVLLADESIPNPQDQLADLAALKASELGTHLQVFGGGIVTTVITIAALHFDSSIPAKEILSLLLAGLVLVGIGGIWHLGNTLRTIGGDLLALTHLCCVIRAAQQLMSPPERNAT